MRDPWGDSELSRRFRESASTHRPRAPLYAALSAGIARDRELYGLLHHAPPTQQLPVLLFAIVHALLLAEPEHPLAAWYPNLTDVALSPDDVRLLPTFKDFVDERGTEVIRMLATRTTQTNEIGRCGLMMPAMAMISDEVGPISHLDVGASGGLNLFVDRYAYRYIADDGGPDHEVGGPSTVTLTTHTRGIGPIPSELPRIAARCGIDRRPIDVTDDTETRWLEACVWPDQRERFLRLRAAIELASEHPPELLAGDAVDSLIPTIDRLGRMGHLVVTTSWVLNYLTGKRRLDFATTLERIGATTDLTWIAVESPAMTPELSWSPEVADSALTVLRVTAWRNGAATTRSIATAHPHGFWVHWH